MLTPKSILDAQTCLPERLGRLDHLPHHGHLPTASQALCLGITGQDCTSVHVVTSTDTCVSIADAAGTNFSTVLANNPNVNSDCSNIYPGEVRDSEVLSLPCG